MPTLERTYLDYDLTWLRAVAAQAGVELSATNARAAAAELAAAVQHAEAAELLLTRVTGQTAEARAALDLLLQNEGRFAASPFARRFGEPRPLGEAARARERPWEQPANATEALYFNGLIGRVFMESETGPQEFFFIPSDLTPHLPQPSPPSVSQAAEMINTLTSVADEHRATSFVVDDAATVLAYIQCHAGRAPDPAAFAPHLRLPAADLLLSLLCELKLIAPEWKLDRNTAKPFLESPRADQLRALCEAWRDSKNWNDLLRVPTLRAEPGAWRNDPAAARAFVLRWCADLPVGEWQSLDSLAAYVREHHADFQRPAGDYDSWYIRDAASGGYLRGFEHWDHVDGALIRFLITGPMHWLGLADICAEPAAFRLTPVFPAFIGKSEWSIPEQPKPISLKPDGTLIVHRSVNRFDRFQAARIGEWLALAKHDEYEYRISGGSLQAASRQGITARHITAFLRRACEQPVPQLVLEAIERWGQKGVEAHAARCIVLRVNDAGLLDLLRRSPKTKHYLGNPIGDLAIEVKNWEKLREGMMELGIAAEYTQTRQ